MQEQSVKHHALVCSKTSKARLADEEHYEMSMCEFQSVECSFGKNMVFIYTKPVLITLLKHHTWQFGFDEKTKLANAIISASNASSRDKCFTAE